MPFLAEVGSPTFALTTALLITIGLILWQSQRQWLQTWRRSRWDEEPEAWPARGPTLSAEDLARWELRMHEMVRDLQGQLDTKMALVVELVVRADQTIRQLEAALAQAHPLCPKCATCPSNRVGEAPSNGAGVDTGLTEMPEWEPMPESSGQFLGSADQTQPAEVIKKSVPRSEVNNSAGAGEARVSTASEAFCGQERALSTAEVPPRSGFQGEQPATACPSETYSRILRVSELLSAGLPSHEVAAQTGLSFGEVELVQRLSLLRQQAEKLPSS